MHVEMEDLGVMGKSRKTKIKRLGDEILEHHAEYFTTNFEENKKMVAEIVVIASKKIRNQVAGYITHTLNARANEEHRMQAQRPYSVSTR
jgi:small subunit ribosomal protein S17e